VTHLVLIAVLATDGGTGWQQPLYGTCPEAPPPVAIDGGSWILEPARAARVECLMATCLSRQEQLEAAPATPTGVMIGVAVGVVLGAVLGGYVVWRIGP
jgi:hypothetical protein